MTQIEVLCSIMRGKNELADVPLGDLIALLADRIAAVSSKLDEDELAPLISIGTALYQSRHLPGDTDLDDSVLRFRPDTQ